jgi:hypothetical protein
VLPTGGEDTLAGISHGAKVGRERFEKLEVDEVAHARILGALIGWLGDGVQLLGDLPALAQDDDEVWTVEADGIKGAPGMATNSSSPISAGAISSRSDDSALPANWTWIRTCWTWVRSGCSLISLRWNVNPS